MEFSILRGEEKAKMKSLKKWALIARPKTLSAGAVPVVIGGSLAYYYGAFDFFYFSLALLCALLIQILANVVNEIYDYQKGADAEDRIGPKRMVASGEISLESAKKASYALAALSFALGSILIYRGGPLILVIGVFSLVFAWAYTGGPFPLAYLGLGEFFAIAFFGVAAVCGTYWVLAKELNSVVVLSSLAPGFISAALLEVNNVRDAEQDARVGKKTLAVRFGAVRARNLFAAFLIGALAVPFATGHIERSPLFLAPILAAPYFFSLISFVKKNDGAALNKALAKTSLALSLYGALASAGVILAKAI